MRNSTQVTFFGATIVVLLLSVVIVYGQSSQNDGIPNTWKIQHGLSTLDPSVTDQIAPGSTLTWLQVYQNSTNLASLPLAYFRASSSTVIAGSSNATVQIAFTKP